MIQEILTLLVLVAVGIWLVARFRVKTDKEAGPCGGCASSSCGGCPAIDLKAEAERRKKERNQKL
jgi:hypothetical protein